MATRITALDHPWAINGAVERKFVEAPSGRQWVLVHTRSNGGRLFYSENQGATWTAAGGVPYAQSSTILSFHIDAEGFAHVAWLHWDASPQHVHYSRGVPSANGRSFFWTTVRLTPAANRLGHDVDVVAFRRGTGWVVWLYFEWHDVGSRLARVGVSPSGALTVEATSIDPGPNTAGVLPFGGVQFAHTGDGVTPQTAPHVFALTASRRNLAGGVVPDVRLHRGFYQSGDWTFGTDTVRLEQITIEETTAAFVFDGSLVCTAWCPTNSNVVRFATWDGAATTVARIDPPLLPTGVGTVNGLSISHDPVSDDIFLFIHDLTDGDIRWTRLSRAAGTWSPWAVAITRTAYNADNKVQALRHPRFGNVDIIYANFTSDTAGTLFHARVVALSRKPGVPALVAPANGALRDLNRGATFTHDYVPAGPGDTQSAWTFRRRYGTITEFWNVGSQAWQATEVFNLGSAEATSFPPGVWPPATTYSWSVKTRSATSVESNYAPERTVVSTTAPVVEVTSPSGLIYTESTPLITFDYTADEPLRSYEMRVVVASSTIDPANPGPAVWTSGVVTSSVARQHRVDIPLDPDVAYRAYVRATSTAGLSSVWDYNDFSLTLLPPSGPLVGVVEDYAYPTEIPRARLNISGRTNYLDVSQDIGQVGWEALVNATVAPQEADLSQQIDASLRITTVAAGLASARTVIGSPPSVAPDLPQPRGPLDFPVLPGVTYTGLAAFRAGLASRAGRISIEWYDNDEGTGALISTSVGSQVNLTTTSYTQAFITAAAPTGARLGRVVVEALGSAGAGEVYYVTRMSLHPGSVAVWQPGGFAFSQTIRVERSDDEGRTWRTVIDRVRTDFWQRAVAVDRTMRLGKPSLYRAVTDVDLDKGAKLTSGLSPVSLATIESDDWIIRDPDDEAGEIFAYVTDLSRGDTEAAVAHRPAGREFPVIDSEGRQSPEGTLQIFVPQSAIPATVELLRRPKTLLVQSPIGEVVKMRFVQRDYAVDMIRHRTVDLNFYEME